MIVLLFCFTIAAHKVEDSIMDRLERCKYINDQRIPETRTIGTGGTIFEALCSSEMNIFDRDESTFKCDDNCDYDNCITNFQLNLTTANECMDIVGIIPYKTRFVRIYPGRYWINSPEYASITEYRDVIRSHNNFNILIDNIATFNIGQYVEYPDLYTFQVYVKNGNSYHQYDIRTKEFIRSIGVVEGLVKIRDLYSYKYKISRNHHRVIKRAKYIWDPQMTAIDEVFTRDIFITLGGKRHLYGLYFHTNVCNKTIPTIENATFVEPYNDTDPVVIEIETMNITGNGSIIFVPVYNLTEICCSTDYMSTVIWIIGTVVPPLVVCVAFSIMAIAVVVVKYAKKDKLKYSI